MSLDLAPALPTADTTLAALTAADPGALGRLAQIHPAFGLDDAIPGAASLAAIAEATGIPLDVILATARGTIHVTAPAGGCGCSCGGGGHH